ncbi:MAG: hypothetical protein ACRD0O_19440 [Acidimicrobiia bacterium]
MTKSAAPIFHDTKSPLSCCARCHKAELLGRALRRPVFRYDKVEVDGGPSRYRVFHGGAHVATLSREPTRGPARYDVAVEWDSDGGEIKAVSLQDARAQAEEAYTAVWREGKYVARGPVQAL